MTGRATRISGHIYNTDEKAWKYRTAEWYLSLTLFGKYIGSIIKGWWRFGPWTDMERVEVQFSIGGEDNMVQFGGALPFLGRAYFGVKIPRALTRGWIYEKRYWGFDAGMSWALFRISFADERHMRDCGMVDYYRKARQRGDDLSWNRVQLWPGFQWSFQPRIKDRLRGKLKYATEEIEKSRSVVPMPEGNYPCEVTIERATWERPRWPFSRKVVVRAEVEPDIPVPVPGKDYGDDAIFNSTFPARSVGEAVAGFASGCLRDRERYANLDWVPSKGWPEGIVSRA